MTMGELTAGCHDPRAAAFAHGGREMLGLQYFFKLLYAGERRTFKISPGVLVEWNKVNLGAQASQQLR